MLGFKGVALGTSLAAGVNFAVLALAWRKRYGRLAGEGIFRHLARVLAASAVLAAVAWGTARGLAAVLHGRGLATQLVLGLAPVAAGGIAYLAAAKVLRIPELEELVAALRRRRRAGTATEA